MTASSPQAQAVSPHQLAARLQSSGDNPLLLDVRTPGEYAGMHLEGSRLVPLDDLHDGALRQIGAEARPVVVICRSGARARKAADKLAALNLPLLQVLDGGVLAWERAGLPLNRGKGGLSLERQVRIAAGVLVLLGVILGTWGHSGFYGISAFVGAGLTFAGLTDWCGMGLLLAKAPWNRLPSSCAGDSCACSHGRS